MMLTGCTDAPDMPASNNAAFDKDEALVKSRAQSDFDIQSAIDKAAPGETVYIPAGEYVTGTIRLHSDMTLVIDENATIIGTDDLDAYDHYRPTKDMTRYDTGAGTRNANLTGDARWTKALILAQNVKNVTIMGGGTINGMHRRDPQGEESMRGPHGILIAESENVTVKDIKIRKASNYAVLGYELVNSTFDGLDIEEGWDGIHIRGGEKLTIKNCDIKTGDDAIAGGYWKGMTISNCKLNSSCNGVRMIEPSSDFTIEGCNIYGPGKFPHITSGNTTSIYGIVFEPGAWGYAPGHTENVKILNSNIDRMGLTIVYNLGDGCTANGLLVDGVVGTNIRSGYRIVSQQTHATVWDNIDIRNSSVNGR